MSTAKEEAYGRIEMLVREHKRGTVYEVQEFVRDMPGHEVNEALSSKCKCTHA
jgi:hypothetical protein